ncbi:Pachytene checkpoint protein 2 [Mortierella claussenii]|nr:Pachytene checkpoint protein 2 [Mortierella claussenii]
MVGHKQDHYLPEMWLEPEAEDGNDRHLPAMTWKHVEVRLTPKCSIPYHTIQEHVHLFLLATRTSLTCFQEVVVVGTSMSDYSYVRMFVERIWVAECSDKLLTQETSIDMDHVYLQFHLYQLHDQGAIEEYGGHAIGDGSDMEGTLTMAYHWELPCQEFEGIWSNLIFEEELQLKLLDYVRTTMLFSDKHVNPDLIAWNRVVLLHGPPGTGKTSLCRGLAQKLSIRLEGRYQHVKLLEINSHSLFSKWYSESGKLVQRMFDQIWTMVEDEGAFICVLIDEVESLAAARRAALSGNEPSDSIRVVNALLTQIDRLRKRKNVLILTTSNITEAIDIAFIDRADIKLYVGLPTKGAIYSILQSTIEELMRVGIIRPKVQYMHSLFAA